MNFFGGKTVRILSIDGGGIRGLIPALVLRELRDRLRGRGVEKPFSEQFDLIAGTSAGALVALGLVLPAARAAAGEPAPHQGVQPPVCYERRPALEIDDIVELYRKRGTEIFPRHRFNSLRKVVQAFADKYESSGLETVLREVFADATIRDALTNVLITSYDTEHMEP
ncbi:MAG TPA: patatin-like phospholipase family protein, partial [Spirochaetia bacterium]|nr:patatin-like phospholipase family protein [Spirochaetia bacterium]